MRYAALPGGLDSGARGLDLLLDRLLAGKQRTVLLPVSAARQLRNACRPKCVAAVSESRQCLPIRALHGPAGPETRWLTSVACRWRLCVCIYFEYDLSPRAPRHLSFSF